MAVMAINISASDHHFPQVALKVLDERAARTLAASGAPGGGDLDISLVHLEYALMISRAFLLFLLPFLFPDDATKQIACPTAGHQGLWACLP